MLFGLSESLRLAKLYLLFLQPVHDLLKVCLTLDPVADPVEPFPVLALLAQLGEHLLEELSVLGLLRLALGGRLDLQAQRRTDKYTDVGTVTQPFGAAYTGLHVAGLFRV